MLRDKKNLRIEEIKVPKNSWTIGKSLANLDLRKSWATNFGISRPYLQAYNYSPKSDDLIQENMTLITMGEPDQINNLEKFIK